MKIKVVFCASLLIGLKLTWCKSCEKYNSLLPNGVCKDLIGEYKIAQNKSEATIKNNILKTWYNEILGYADLIVRLKNVDAAVKQIVTLNKKCYRGAGLDEKARLLLSLNPTKYVPCILNNKKFSCLVHHPPCLKDNDGSIHVSYPCKETCTMFTKCYDEAKIVYNLVSTFHKGYTCKGHSDYSHALEAFVNEFEYCNRSLNSDMKFIEGCQMFSTVNESKKISRQLETSCKDKGESYNGFETKSETGKPCLNWNSFPYLTKENYPSLEKNYCRNPQGYGKRPWCYINKERMWEYCKVCVNTNNPKQRQKKNDASPILVFYLIGASALLFCVSITIIVMVKRFRKSSKTEIEEPYDVMNIEDTKVINETLAKFKKFEKTKENSM